MGGAIDLVWRWALALLLSLTMLGVANVKRAFSETSDERGQQLSRHFAINLGAQLAGDSLVTVFVSLSKGNSDHLFSCFIATFMCILLIVCLQYRRTTQGVEGMGTDLFFALLVVLNCFAALAGFLEYKMAPSNPMDTHCRDSTGSNC